LGATYQPLGTVTKKSMCELAKQLAKLWKSKKISLSVKTRLYEALVLSTLLNSAKL